MMLSPKAKVDAIPRLLVNADDVSASHGGTVGELDEAADLLHAVARPPARGGGPRDRRGLLRAGHRRVRRTRLEEFVRARIAREARRGAEDIDAYAAGALMATARRHRWLDVRADFPILAREIDGSRSSTSTRRPRRRSRRPSSTRWTASTASQRERAPRRLHARAGGDRALRGRARAHRRVRRRRAATRRSSPATRPRRSTSSRTPWGRDNVGPGDVVLVTEMEHHSNLVPWQLLCAGDRARAALPRRRRATARLSLDELDAELAERPT